MFGAVFRTRWSLRRSQSSGPRISALRELDSFTALNLLSQLHGHKNAGYGNAWRKRGELLSIFTNLARKYDRLVVALDQGKGSSDERILDTAGDLCVYAAKYLTWLAEQHPKEFEAASNVGSEECADDGGSGAVDRVLAAVEVPGGKSVAESWRAVKAAFEPLDRALVAQAEEGEALLGWERKIEFAWEIAAASAALLIALAAKDAEELEKWQAEIEAMG
jgi:hypothetical protein